MGAVALAPWATTLAAWVPACPWKEFVGLPCLSCGTTRAALSLARFDFAEAFVRYPLPAAAWAVFVVGGIVSGAVASLGREPPSLPERLSPGARVGLVAAVLLNWFYAIATGV